MIRLAILRLLESFFRHRWMYLSPIVIMAMVGTAVSFTTPPTYLAKASLFVEDESLLASLTDASSDFSWQRTPAQTVSRDFYELLQTDAFVRSAIQRTALEANMSQGQEQVTKTLAYFREAVSAVIVGNKLVSFQAEDVDPRLAQQMVVASIDAYIFWKVNAEYQESVAAQNFFANLIEPYEQELQVARDELVVFLASYPPPVRGERPIEEQVELARLQTAVDEATRRLADTRAKEENARLALSKAESIARQTYQVIDAPEVPAEPLTGLRQRATDILIFMTVGFLLSIFGVIGGALLDRSYRFPIDVHHGLSLPVLAILGRNQTTPAPAHAPQPQPSPAQPEQPVDLPPSPVMKGSERSAASSSARASARQS